MKTIFKTIVSSFKTLKELQSAEKSIIRESIPISEPDSRFGDFHKTPRGCEAALNAFLEAQPDDFLYALIALMQDGRRIGLQGTSRIRASYPAEYWHSLKDSFDREYCIRALVDIIDSNLCIDKGIASLPYSFNIEDVPKLFKVAVG